MQSFDSSPKTLIHSIWLNKNLTFSLIKREISGRYHGSLLGIFWSFFNPLLMLTIYTFVFSDVFNGKWGTKGNSKADFALLLFAGLIIFNFFSECLNRAPSTIINHTNYVKKIVFPLEILPLINVGAALFHSIISIAVWIVFYCCLIGIPHATIIFFPFALIPIIFLATGVSWFLSALGVYLRDTIQVVGAITTILMFLSPIFYPIEALPLSYQPLLSLNPLAPAISAMRDFIYWGNIPSIFDFIIYNIICILFSFLGFFWFQKTRKGFADVL